MMYSIHYEMDKLGVENKIIFSLWRKKIEEQMTEFDEPYELLEPFTPKDDDILILWGSQSYFHSERQISRLKLFKKVIFFNSEPITCKRWNFLPKVFEERLPFIKHIIDYSPLNARMWAENGFKFVNDPLEEETKDELQIEEQKEVYWLKIGYTPVMDIWKKNGWKRENILGDLNHKDIIFFGNLNDHRREYIGVLNHFTQRVGTYNGMFFEQFEETLKNNHKATFLNIHYEGGDNVNPLETYRLLPLLCSGLKIVSQKSHDNFSDDLFEPYITFLNKENKTIVKKDFRDCEFTLNDSVKNFVNYIHNI